MTIIYSPEFNSTSYINLEQRKGQLLGLKVCGSTELLSELELRAGIAVQELSEPERLVAYHDDIKYINDKSNKEIDKKNIMSTIFGKSFETDGIGVTRQLLSWRDNLLMAGWDPQKQQCSKKLEDISFLESKTKVKSPANRWNEVFNYVTKHQLLNEGDYIEVYALPEAIPFVIRRVLDELQNKGFAKYIPSGRKDKECQLIVYNFKTRIAAYQWYLSSPEALKDINVTISNDNCMLDDLSISQNKPKCGSRSDDSNPQILQLFKLGMSLFARPLNVYNLLSYLQVSGHPAKGIAYKLAKVLASEGGVNHTWDETIRDYDFTDKEDDDKRSECLKYISMVTLQYEADEIPVYAIKNYANDLAHWCDKQSHSKKSSDERNEQLSVLASFCRSLIKTIKDKESITSEKLLVAVDGIYQPHSFTHFKAEKDSPDFVSSITQLADNVDNVCWLGCVGGSLPSYPFDFLNAEEIDKLNKERVHILSKPDFYTQYHQILLDFLKKINKQLILVCWEYDGNERQEEHPLITELKNRHQDNWSQMVINNATPNIKESSEKVQELTIKPNYQLKADKLKSLKRKMESNSSISTLIQCPFDYTLGYLLQLKEPTIGQLADLDKTKGLVAHRFIENFVKEYRSKMPEKLKQMTDNELDARIEDAINQKGAILQLPEYKMEKQQFLATLRKSARVLCDIITELKLQPVDCEVKMEVNLDIIGAFEANVDMVLQQVGNPSNYVLFDFKWSELDSFEKSLKEKRAMQLELYSEAATKYYGKSDPSTKVVGVAYYLFPKYKLFSNYFQQSEHIVHVKVNDDASKRVLLKEIKNSYSYRRGELNDGFVEDSELCKIEELAYDKASKTQPMFPLKEDSTKKGMKKGPYVRSDKPAFASKSVNRSDKKDLREIKTTHSILKGRLS